MIYTADQLKKMTWIEIINFCDITGIDICDIWEANEFKTFKITEKQHKRFKDFQAAYGRNEN